MSEIDGYSNAVSALRLLAVPKDREVQEQFSHWAVSAHVASSRDSLGATVNILSGETRVSGRVRAIEAAFWLALGDDPPIAFSGGIEVGLGDECDCERLELGAPAFAADGDLLGFVVATDNEIAMLAPAAPLFENNGLEIATLAQIREHNERVGADRFQVVEASHFGDRIREFGMRVAASSAFYSRTVGA
ncbi:hypothetical protein [Novosphingobium sp.]|uniref:hypothetical protein n=1 Tax=Novosphingobium sp. TaxID=1874826 RepID=UPI003BABBA5A